ncbi:S-layer homology domain-containing protein [Anaerovorax odorimutans]|uniref:S-layer homology domain-containing protein n=1 Tax=Anaerovorax odorimutans TaxID=109327 RepID=UPI0004841FC9|nr:S-layer homology domain-containing protein [Anaerovorax odorimutans]
MKINRRKSISVLLVIVMVMTVGLNMSFADNNVNTNSDNTTTKSEGITDIKGHWAETNIKEAVKLGIVNGYPDGKFLPDNLIKREEFFKLITNVLTQTPDASNVNLKFKDVVADEWYVPTIKIAVAGNLTQGYEDGTFGIGKMMSRQEAAKVAASVIQVNNVPEGAKGAESVKDKNQIGEWAYPYVDIMFKKGYMKGDTEGNFRPTNAITRAEATTILLNISKKEEIIAANADELAMSGCLKIHKAEDGAFTKGDGTKDDPYQISTEKQLNHLRVHANEAAFYILTNDIKITKDFATRVPAIASKEQNWSEGNFEPIGTEENPFKGYLDGDRHTISGLEIIGFEGGSVGSDGGERAYAANTALFGYLGKNASVVSLTVDKSTIKGGRYTAGIAAYNLGTIKDCILGEDAKVTGKTYTGGIVGYSEKPLVSNINKGTVTGSDSSTGGVAGYIYASQDTISSCVNVGEVNGKERTGGVIGTIYVNVDGDPVVKNCSNKGDVNVGSYRSGGVIGYIDANSGEITVENCYNKGLIAGGGVNGGVVGDVKGRKVTITECYNEGSVTGGSGGGIAGSNEGTIQYSYNKGNVVGNVEAGGITAFQNDRAVITKCYNEGSVTSNSYAGGIAGTNGTEINNCYNSGKVKGTNSIGGIAGKNEGTIKNVYGAGKVTGDNGAGSLIGRNIGKLKNSFWLEDSCSDAVGMSDTAASQDIVKSLSHEELSGQKKMKTSKGYVMVIDVMNSNNSGTDDVWEYIYRMTSKATDKKTTVISDGGGIVRPLEEYSTDIKGNVIKESDLDDVYLYPCIVEM